MSAQDPNQTQLPIPYVALAALACFKGALLDSSVRIRSRHRVMFRDKKASEGKTGTVRERRVAISPTQPLQNTLNPVIPTHGNRRGIHRRYKRGCFLGRPGNRPDFLTCSEVIVDLLDLLLALPGFAGMLSHASG